MHSKHTFSKDELLTRLQHLEQARLNILDALELAAKSGDFRQSLGSFEEPLAVLRDTAQRVMALAPFRAVALWLVNESTADFELGWCESNDSRDFMLDEFEQLTQEGIVALALNGEQPVLAAGSALEHRHVLQVLATPSRVRGLLAAHFEGCGGLPDGTLPLLSIFCQSAAASLEGLELYRLLRMKNEALQEEMQARRDVQARQELLSQAFLSSLEGMLVADASGRILEVNPAACAMSGYTQEELVGRMMRSFLTQAGVRRHFRGILREIAAHGRFKGELKGRDKQGNEVFVWLSIATVHRKDGGIRNHVAVLHSMAGRKELETALVQAELKFRDIVEQAPVAIFRTTLDGRPLDVNPAYAKMLGYASPEEIVHAVTDIARQLYVNSQDREGYTNVLLKAGMVMDYEVRLRRKDGSMILASLHSRLIRDFAGRVVSINGFMRDITAERMAEEERERLQKQLHQSRKMESVGRLAGGMAHDFNNMLGVIIGQAQLALTKLNAEDPAQRRLLEIEKTAQRSASLVRQLLAFARKQPVVPIFLNLNDAIAGMLNMLERLVSANITLAWKPGDGLWLVKIDPSQVDQILINLMVNAQDAISGPGVVTIATHNVLLSEAFCREQEDVSPGEYVLLTVRDTGCGMDRETLEQIFEPFFTTKDVGQGTGLGLATVYGIIKQNSGLINVFSEPGQGTTFSIYFPRLLLTVQKCARALEESQMRGGSATVLVVEDERSLLDFTQEALAALGYAVLTAESPWEAIRLIQNHHGHIDLLITDVVMPEMNGWDLSLRIQALKPGTKCLFMSGYARDVIVHHGVLDDGLNFLQKPFTLNELAQKVLQVIESNGQPGCG